MKHITPDELKQWREEGKPFSLIDIREQSEWDAGHFEEAIHLPASMGNDIIDKIAALPAPRVIYCASGGRSGFLCNALTNEGVEDIYNLQFGYHGYQLFHA